MRAHLLKPCLILTVLLAACSDFPDLPEGGSDAARDAPYPRIVPIDGLLVRALGPRAGSATGVNPLDAEGPEQAQIDARISALLARADLMRGAPVDADTRARLARVQ